MTYLLSIAGKRDFLWFKRPLKKKASRIVITVVDKEEIFNPFSTSREGEAQRFQFKLGILNIGEACLLI